MKEKIEKYSIFKLILIMGFPPIISMLIQSLYSIIDAIFVSMISDCAFNAISLAFPFQNIILSLAVGMGVGINSYVSRTQGQNKMELSKEASAKGFVLSIYHYFLIVLLGIIVIPFFFNLFTKDTTVINQGRIYLYILTFLSFGQIGHIAVEKILQANGNMIAPTIFQILGCVVNIVLDALFILVFKWGITGAAIATVIGQIVSFVTIFIFCIKKEYIKLNKNCLKIDKFITARIYDVAIPSFMLMVFPSILTFILNSILASYSQNHVSVLGVYFKLQTFIYMPASGLIQGLRPIFGYLYGGGYKTNLKESLKYGLLLLFIMMSIGFILFMGIPGLLMDLFTKNNEIKEIGISALRIICIGFIPSSITLLIVSLFEAIGYGKESLIISLSRLLVIPVLFSVFTTYILSKSSFYIFLSFSIAEWLSLILAVIIYYKFNTKKKDYTI